MNDKITLNGVTLDVDSVRKALAEYDAKPKKGEIDWERVKNECYFCHFFLIPRGAAFISVNWVPTVLTTIPRL